MKVTLAGSNRFEIQRQLSELIHRFVSKYGELAVEKIDGSEAGTEAAVEAVASLPFLAKRKLVILYDLSANKSASEQIEQIISSVNDSVDIVFYEPGVDRRSAYFKVLSSQTELKDYRDLGEEDLAKWLVAEAKKQTAAISLGDARYLIQRVGDSQALLANELNKLITYDKTVNRASIDLLTEETAQSQIFDLLDAAFSGRQSQALRLYEEQRAQKVEPQVIISMIVWQLQQISLVAAAGNMSDAEIAREAGLKPYPVQKARALSDKTDSRQLKKLINDLLKIDYIGKTKPLELDEALKTYIVTI